MNTLFALILHVPKTQKLELHRLNLHPYCACVFERSVKESVEARLLTFLQCGSFNKMDV